MVSSPIYLCFVCLYSRPAAGPKPSFCKLEPASRQIPSNKSSDWCHSTDKQMKPVKTDQTWQLNKKKRPSRREEDVCGLTGTRLHPLITVASCCDPLGLISGRRCLPRGEGNEKWLSREMLYMNSVLLTFKMLTSCFSCSSQKQWSWQFDA